MLKIEKQCKRISTLALLLVFIWLLYRLYCTGKTSRAVFKPFAET